MDSILTSIKKMLGIVPDYDIFDVDLTIHINSAFMILNQLGIGPKDAFRITGKDETWDLFQPDPAYCELLKSYIYLRVKLMFDPPTNSFLVNAIEDQIKEFEWRLITQVEGVPSDG